MIAWLALLAAVQREPSQVTGDWVFNATRGSAALSRQYNRCFRANEQEMGWRLARCGRVFVEGEEALLQKTWARVKVRYPEEGRQALIDEQKAWTAYMKASCENYAAQGWNARAISWPSCRARVIAFRVRELEDIEADLKQAEDDDNSGR